MATVLYYVWQRETTRAIAAGGATPGPICTPAGDDVDVRWGPPEPTAA